MDASALNLVDVAAAALLIAGLFGGIRSGALPQLGGLFGAIGGAAVLLSLTPLFRDVVDSIDGPFRALVVLAGLVAGVGAGEVLGSAIGRAISSALGDGVLGFMDRAFGAFVGIGQALLIVWLVGGILAIGPSALMARQAQRSLAVRATSQALPPVSEVATDVGGLIDRSGLPQVFVGLEPIPAAPVDTPVAAEARRIAADAVASTVEVRSVACSYELTGSGFVIAKGYVVTNAHVVAGAETSRVLLGDETYPARVVLFDPGLDIALLRAPTLDAPALHFATRSPARGDLGAVLGHPGGAPLTVIPAAVNAAYRAEGRDLYGVKTVVRDILELRAGIERGDSGGPLILEDGSVGGVVFAEARSDQTIGYALDPGAVSAAIERGLTRTKAADTGRCVR